MKEGANDLAQRLPVIMLTVTLAISMAAFSLWAGSDSDAPAELPAAAVTLAASS